MKILFIEFLKEILLPQPFSLFFVIFSECYYGIALYIKSECCLWHNECYTCVIFEFCILNKENLEHTGARNLIV